MNALAKALVRALRPDITIDGAEITVNASGNANITAGGDIVAKGTSIKLNC